MSIPSDTEILTALDLLWDSMADELELPNLEFKPWVDAKSDMRVAIEYAACFANAEGGVIVVGVADKALGGRCER